MAWRAGGIGRDRPLPWLGYKATDRITVWGVAGYGAGGLLLTPEGGPALESGLSRATVRDTGRAVRRGERFRAGVRHVDRRRGRRGGAHGGDRGDGDPVPDGVGRVICGRGRNPTLSRCPPSVAVQALRFRRRGPSGPAHATYPVRRTCRAEVVSVFRTTG